VATYNYITQAQFLTQLANRLSDSGELFWSHTEKTLYLQEALRTFNALTGFWRGDFIGNTSNGITFYDLTNTTTFPNTLRPITLRDTDLYGVIQYQLLEPSIGVNPWTGVSTQFSADDLINSVQRRRDELLGVSGCTISRRTIGASAGRTLLLDSVVDVRRLAYLPNSPGVNSVVWPDDTWGEQSYNRSYTTKPAGVPFTYLLNAQPPLSFDTDRPPAFAGFYELLTVESGPALSASTPSSLLVPDDWAWAIKWGALSDLLSKDANSRDLPRAAYCETRYKMASALLASAPALLAARIANVPLQIDAIRNADLFRTTWQALAHARPDTLLTCGLNLVAAAPIPDAGPYSLTLTVVQNAPIPANDGDNVQVAREHLDSLLDYCVHLALFKCGGLEFQMTTPLLERFIKDCAQYNSMLAEWGNFSKIMQEVSQQEEMMNPRAVPQTQGA